MAGRLRSSRTDFGHTALRRNVIGSAATQTCGRWLNNRAKNSHQPFRRWEAAMARFKDIKILQKFSSVHASIHNHFNTNAISTAATFSNGTEPPPWPSGVNSQLESP